MTRQGLKILVPKNWAGIALFLLTLCTYTPASFAVAPHVHTQAAAINSSTDATLNGMAVANGESTIVWFEWGRRGQYDQTTNPTNIGSGTVVVHVNAPLAGLQTASEYQCRLVASNSAGTAHGSIRLFTTGSKIVAWGKSIYGEANPPSGLNDIVQVAGGGSVSMALRAGGTVVAWGADTNLPAGLSNVAAITGGLIHRAALRKDGTVVAWGSNGNGATNVPPGLTDVIALAGSGYHNLALKADGTVIGWGANEYGQADTPAGLSNITSIAAGNFHSLALKADGTVMAWGRNDVGQTNVPAGLNNVVALDAGGHSVVLKSDGAVVVWGLSGVTNVPGDLTNAVAIAAGGSHSLALRNDKTLAAWGYTSNGQTNVPSELTNAIAFDACDGYNLILASNIPPKVVPQQVTARANRDQVIVLSGSDTNNDFLTFKIITLPAKGLLFQFTNGVRGLLITTEGTVITDASRRVIFAPNTNAIGSPYTTFSYAANDGFDDSAPALVTVNIQGAYAHRQPATLITTNSAVLSGMALPNGVASAAWFEWGNRGAYAQSTTPTNVGNGTAVIRVNTGVVGLDSSGIYQCRLVVSNVNGLKYGLPHVFTTGGRLAAWGNNVDVQVTLPVGLTSVVGVAAGATHNAAVSAGGTAVAWGGPNGFGQRTLPANWTNIVATSVGDFFTLALRSDGSLSAKGSYWNGSTYSTMFVPANLGQVVAIASGQDHNLALRASGRVVAWGNNVFGQTNVPAGLSNVVAIAATDYRSLALKADGTVAAWGDNFLGESTVPDDLNDVMAIGCSKFTSLAIKSDGTVVTWGLTSGTPTNLTDLIAADGGYYHKSVLKLDGTLITWGDYYNGQTYVPMETPPGLTNVVAAACGESHVVALGQNKPPVAHPQNITASANHDLVIGLSGSDTNNDFLTFHISALPQSGMLYQYTNSGRGDAITTPDTVVTGAGNRLIFAPAADVTGDPYASFDFAANDGDADSTPAQVVIRIVGTPYAFTQPTTRLAVTNATLHGMSVPNGFPTWAWFEWGERGNYNLKTADESLGAGSAVIRLNAMVTGLTNPAVYQCRLVASNAQGVAYGAPHFFSTGAKVTGWGNGSGYYGEVIPPTSLTNAVAVGGGDFSSIALKTDGKVVGWGSYFNPTDLAALSNIVAISSAGGPCLKADGTIAGSADVPSGLSNVVAVAGEGHGTGLALRANGTVVGWYGGQVLPLPSGLSNVVAIDARSQQSLMLKADGTVVAWGANTNVPADLREVVAIAAGGSHGLAVRSNGTVVAWSSQFAATNVPVGLSNVVAVAAAPTFSLALRSDGSLVGWGIGISAPTNLPPNLTNVVAIAARSGYALAVGNNVPPTASAGTNSIYPNRDATIQLRGADGNGDRLTFQVASLPVAGTLYQFNVGGRGAQITVPATVTDVSNRVIFAPGANESGSPYAGFTFAANDGEADSTPAPVTINVLIPPAPQMSAARSGVLKLPAPFLSADAAGTISNGGFGLRFMGYSNLTYEVWASTNLHDWLLLGPANAAGNGWLQFVDADATNWPRRFYRISMPTDRAYNLNFSGHPNASYRVWASSNLTNWELLGTASVTSNGWFQFLDFNNAKWPQRFYRAGAP